MAAKIEKVVYIGEGECISMLAAVHGFQDWRHIYDEQTADFKKQRPNPNALYLADAVQIPQKQKLAEQKGAGGVVAVAIAKMKPVRLRIKVVDHHNKPVANKPFIMVSLLGQNIGTTDKDGLIDLQVNPRLTKSELAIDLSPPKAGAAAPAPPPAPPAAPPATPPYPPVIKYDDFKDKIDEKTETVINWSLSIGSLPSHNTEKGTTERLHNLAFIELAGRNTASVVKAYQRWRKKSETGEPADIAEDIRTVHDLLP